MAYLYLLWMLINSGVIINNKNVVSEIWLKRHYVLAWIISIVHMIYRHNQNYYTESWEGFEHAYYEPAVAGFGAATFLLYYLILFLRFGF